MIAAFTYWELTVKHGWPVLPSLVLVILVLAPLMGAAIERLLMRKLHGAPTEVSLVITLGLLLFLLGVGFTRWDPGVPRLLPKFFAGHQLKLFSVVVTYHLIVVVLMAASTFLIPLFPAFAPLVALFVVNGICRGLLRVTSRDAAISRLIWSLRVTPRTRTDIVDVAYSARDPNRAQQVVNRVVDVFRTTSAEAATTDSGWREALGMAGRREAPAAVRR